MEITYGLIDSGAEQVVRYQYNSWGKPLSMMDTTQEEIGEKSPFRYREYCRDEETGLYYVSSRYYDPEIGRFISADDVSLVTASPMTLVDKNLYAYCDNNPVVRKDSNGAFWETALDIISLGASIAEVAVNPSDPWAWASLVGDTIDLIPFITGVGEVTKAVKVSVKAFDDSSDVVKAARRIYNTAKTSNGIRKMTGSYEILYKSGKNYVGKGGFQRAITSANRYVRKNGDKVTSITWKSASNARKAFIDEYLMQKVRGVLKANKKAETYNRIWSPGRRYLK